MKHLKSTALAAIAAMALTVPAFGQGVAYWGEAAGWDILIDPSLNNGCFIQAEYDDDSLVRIGFDARDETGYVSAYHTAWGKIREGEVYSVVFALDGERYDGEATGLYLNGVPGIDIIFDSGDFLFDLARRYTMTLYDGTSGDEVMSFDLEGTYTALENAIECQKSQN